MGTSGINKETRNEVSKMRVFNENGELLKDFDLDNYDSKRGSIRDEQRPVTHIYIVDVPEEKEEYIIKEYPETGGRDIGYRISVKEQGHWETLDENGNEIKFDGVIPEGLPKDKPVEDVEMVCVYHEYTQDELDAFAESDRQEKERQEKAEAREKLLTTLPDTLADSDDALCELYETNAKQQDIIDTQDEAICELYETLGGK